MKNIWTVGAVLLAGLVSAGGASDKHGPAQAQTKPQTCAAEVVATNPAVNQQAVPASTDVISITFSEPVCRDSGDILVNGNRLGYYATEWVEPQTGCGSTLSVRVLDTFFCGEQVTVTLTDGFKCEADSSFVSAYSWQFTTAVSDSSPGVLHHDSTYTPVGFQVAGYPAKPVVADLDGDGDIDIVSPARDGFWTTLNNGDGTFAPPESYNPAGSGHVTLGMGSGDFDGDGDMDIISYHWRVDPRNVPSDDDGPRGAPTAVQSLYVPGPDNIVSMNIGGGRFYAIGGFNFPLYYYWFTHYCTADFDSDGDVDIVYGGLRYPEGELEFLEVFLNNGDGSFVRGNPHFIGGHTWDAIPADFDGDGDLDIAVRLLSGLLLVITNNGDATFENSDTLAAIYGFTSGDMNRDGDVDLVVTSLGALGTETAIYQNNGDATFGQPIHTSLEHRLWLHLEVADLDGDDDLDLIMINSSSNLIGVLLNDGHGVLHTPRYYQIADAMGTAAVADLDGDGDLDVATSFITVILNETECCRGPFTGNVDCDSDEGTDIGDVTAMIRRLFVDVDGEFCCPEEADLDYSGTIDIGDLTILISRLFISMTDPPFCP